MCDSPSLESESSSTLPLSVHPSLAVSQSFSLSHSGSLEPAVKTLSLKTEVDTNLSAAQTRLMSPTCLTSIKEHNQNTHHTFTHC